MTIHQRFLSADEVKAQIARLLTDCPELREDDEGLVLSLESETEATELCTRLVKAIKETEAHSSSVAALISEYRGRQEMLDLRVEKLKTMLTSIIKATGQTKIQLAIGTPFITPTKHVEVTDYDLVPEYYQRPLTWKPDPHMNPNKQLTWEPDKKLIGASLKAGQLVSGCKMSEPTDSLTIRMK
jgi:hypothetical protein